jgi:hypothetical protein
MLTAPVDPDVPAADAIAAMKPEMHKPITDNIRTIKVGLDALSKAIWEFGRPRLIKGGPGDDATTKH